MASAQSPSASTEMNLVRAGSATRPENTPVSLKSSLSSTPSTPKVRTVKSAGPRCRALSRSRVTSGGPVMRITSLWDPVAGVPTPNGVPVITGRKSIDHPPSATTASEAIRSGTSTTTWPAAAPVQSTSTSSSLPARSRPLTLKSPVPVCTKDAIWWSAGGWASRMTLADPVPAQTTGCGSGAGGASRFSTTVPLAPASRPARNVSSVVPSNCACSRLMQ